MSVFFLELSDIKFVNSAGFQIFMLNLPCLHNDCKF